MDEFLSLDELKQFYNPQKVGTFHDGSYICSFLSCTTCSLEVGKGKYIQIWDEIKIPKLALVSTSYLDQRQSKGLYSIS